jgi:hypothetical protein
MKETIYPQSKYETTNEVEEQKTRESFSFVDASFSQNLSFF